VSGLNHTLAKGAKGNSFHEFKSHRLRHLLMKIPQIYLFVFLLILQSCASTRIHEKPNFTLQGKEKEKEFERFRLEHISNYGGRFQSEGILTTFKKKELRSLLNDISPKSNEMLDEIKTKENVQWIVFAAWVSTIFMGKNGNVSPYYWVGAGGYFGYLFYLDYERDKIIDQYNSDLEKKFTPSLSYSFKF
jgi:hypothetical protein